MRDEQSQKKLSMNPRNPGICDSGTHRFGCMGSLMFPLSKLSLTSATSRALEIADFEYSSWLIFSWPRPE